MACAAAGGGAMPGPNTGAGPALGLVPGAEMGLKAGCWGGDTGSKGSVEGCVVEPVFASVSAAGVSSERTTVFHSFRELHSFRESRELRVLFDGPELCEFHWFLWLRWSRWFRLPFSGDSTPGLLHVGLLMGANLTSVA